MTRSKMRAPLSWQIWSSIAASRRVVRRLAHERGSSTFGVLAGVALVLGIHLVAFRHLAAGMECVAQAVVSKLTLAAAGRPRRLTLEQCGAGETQAAAAALRLLRDPSTVPRPAKRAGASPENRAEPPLPEPKGRPNTPDQIYHYPLPERKPGGVPWALHLRISELERLHGIAKQRLNDRERELDERRKLARALVDRRGTATLDDVEEAVNALTYLPLRALRLATDTGHTLVLARSKEEIPEFPEIKDYAGVYLFDRKKMIAIVPPPHPSRASSGFLAETVLHEFGHLLDYHLPACATSAHSAFDRAREHAYLALPTYGQDVSDGGGGLIEGYAVSFSEVMLHPLTSPSSVAAYWLVSDDILFGDTCRMTTLTEKQQLAYNQLRDRLRRSLPERESRSRSEYALRRELADGLVMDQGLLGKSVPEADRMAVVDGLTRAPLPVLRELKRLGYEIGILGKYIVIVVVIDDRRIVVGGAGDSADKANNPLGQRVLLGVAQLLGDRPFLCDNADFHRARAMDYEQLLTAEQDQVADMEAGRIATCAHSFAETFFDPNSAAARIPHLVEYWLGRDFEGLLAPTGRAVP
jgi:hypothetical protein